MRSLSIRVRITLGSALVAAVLLFLVGVGIHFQMLTVTTQSDRTLATSDLEAFMSDIRNNPDETPDQPAAGILVLIKDPAGAYRIDTVPVSLRGALEHHPSGDDTFTVPSDAGKFTVVGKSLATSTGVWQLWAVRSSATSDLTVNEVDRRLAVALAGILIAFTLAAWLLTTLALRPVKKMRAAAEALSETNTTDGLPVGPADDEVAALAVTLNTFLSRVRNTSVREKQMISDASHELRTPIAVMTTQLELAHTHFGDAVALEHDLLSAEASLSRLSRLASNLLELSRLDAAENRQLPSETATATELVTELMGAIDRARMMAGVGHENIQFEDDIVSPDQRYALSPTAFGRVLDNLLINALNASRGAGNIVVSLSQTASALHLRVDDEGTGMPEEFLPHAFDRFSQPDTAQSSGLSGSGLGLALVHSIVTRAEGSVTLANRHPSGLTVEVLIDNV
ncbi:HAMP domain-containing sensor histidine kinase [Subtercola sp. RTI3]|uniref:sensor histidine kinase n=1 Tax=Subtercola sp. RTI3 TaxID=3048639 RepID=UPI002B23B5DF|nr:HAMP domain-containing sensor histidine kinase [Subtercola sp. RTI3]MEA9983846.1 HAMP domain-containing sensor histidine kinase [Subtercola sp. RTI3]